VFLGSHGQFFRMNAKAAQVRDGKLDSFVDPVSCRQFYAQQESTYRAELKRQNP
jgi:hypothetical protein